MMLILQSSDDFFPLYFSPLLLWDRDVAVVVILCILIYDQQQNGEIHEIADGHNRELHESLYGRYQE